MNIFNVIFIWMRIDFRLVEFWQTLLLVFWTFQNISYRYLALWTVTIISPKIINVIQVVIFGLTIFFNSAVKISSNKISS